MSHRLIQLALLLCAASCTHVVQAGELTLYGRENFEGRRLALREQAPDLARAGFAQRPGSMVIVSGRWELCTQTGFRGDCFIAEAGEYRDLRRFINTIASARELEPRPWRGNPRREPGVELFEGEGFDGERVLVRDNLDSLRSVDFNDRAASLIVYGGRWEFCQHKDFGGLCLSYGPGRYEHLGGLHRQISSIRRLR